MGRGGAGAGVVLYDDANANACHHVSQHTDPGAIVEPDALTKCAEAIVHLIVGDLADRILWSADVTGIDPHRDLADILDDVVDDDGIGIGRGPGPVNAKLRIHIRAVVADAGSQIWVISV